MVLSYVLQGNDILVCICFVYSKIYCHGSSRLLIRFHSTPVGVSIA